MNYIRTYKTMTDYTMFDAIERLKKVLKPEAYQAMQGNPAGLTDISPAFLTEVATSVFGPVGIGWAYEVIPSMMECALETRQGRNSNYETYSANVAITLRYRYDTGDGLVWSEPIFATGGADNTVKSFAVRGAITNAIGSAFAKLCWQLYVYQGYVTHNNAAAAYQRQLKNLGVENMKPEPETDKDKAETTKQAPVATPAPVETAPVEAAPGAQPEVVDAQVSETVPEPTGEISEDPEAHLTWARNRVVLNIPGVPMQGKKLGDLVDGNTSLGKAMITYLAGIEPRADGTFFVPKDQEQQHLLDAAKLLYEKHLKTTSKKK